MPYFVYKILLPMRILEKVKEFDGFKDASKYAKEFRTTVTADDNCIVKVIFGENELEAEDILSQVRDPQPTTGEDY
ncbi:hypothetical protein [Sulfurirhabdus autotrophica]|uniref:Uncharacterized protein n=1 Tax=Sulfurirhabdus autotrophica TaxID=1706046 RepID=A0A4R3XYH7_9PROT|nr:hypothetical protein [Sulfurirhabdus autotrophica]TCV84127.1 hypothetical protein EDC63_11363 [Sulfurirhabdus autotrophica]